MGKQKEKRSPFYALRADDLLRLLEAEGAQRLMTSEGPVFLEFAAVNDDEELARLRTFHAKLGKRLREIDGDLRNGDDEEFDDDDEDLDDDFDDDDDDDDDLEVPDDDEEFDY